MTMQQQIEQKLQQAFAPSHLTVSNESQMHRVAPGAESHFKVVLVSAQFVGQRPLARHRAVNSVLADGLAGAGDPGRDRRDPGRVGLLAEEELGVQVETGRLAGGTMGAALEVRR